MAVTLPDLLEAISVVDNAVNRKKVMRISAAVVDLIRDYSPDAPDSIKDQAMVQCVGYIYESPSSAPARQNFANAMANSGAHAMLAPWRTHQAGVIGGSS